MNCFEYLNSELIKIKDLQTERSFYPILKEFLKKFSEEHLENKREINVISEASSKVHETKIGFPDLTIQVKHYDFKTVGWVEVKLPKDSLNDAKFKEQFNRYTDSLENVLFTNLREWELYQWDEKGKPKKVDEVLFDVSENSVESKALITLLNKFFDGKVLEIRTPKQLALSLARKTRLLSKQVEESLEEAIKNEDKDNNLIKLKSAFSNTLIKDIAPHQFANMAAETIAYSFFLAALEHQKRGSDDLLTLRTAIDYLPNSVPVLRDLYDLIGKSANSDATIKLSVESLIEQFQKADMEKIYNALSKHQIGQDPVINFYEPFLAEYDPEERKARGVYYTPKPVVDYIVKSVDWILREKFGKVAGIEDREVYLLDPATGTGTFLMSAIEMIAESKRRQFGPLGNEIVKKEFIRVAQNHILKHFFGFELMIAPYAIAHLKLTMLLEEFGFDFSMTKDNGDKDDDRLKIYLANTLDEPHGLIDDGQMSLFSFHQSISEESRLASEVKTNKPIMAVIGNPPYSNFGRMNRNEWILNLLKDYKKNLKEKKINLDDDYIKFIRFAQWKIEQTGEGVIAMITNNSFIDGTSHRQMRKNLMETFDEIYIYNLHGSARRGEESPDGSADENVFNIMTGVSINIFVKKDNSENKLENCKVFYSDLWGAKNYKLENVLRTETAENTKWIKLDPKKPQYFFIQKDVDEKYDEFYDLKEIFNNYVTGVESQKDKICIADSLEKVKATTELLCSNETDEEIRKKFEIEDSRDWKLREVREYLLSNKNDNNFTEISYRPFDLKWTYFDRNFLAYPRKPIMDSLRKDNCALICSRQSSNKDWSNIFVSSNIVERCFISIKTREGGYVFPLFATTDEFTEDKKQSNIHEKFSLRIGDDIKCSSFSDENLFDYIYGMLHLRSYREKYSDQLKSDFPRIPFPSQLIESKLIGEEIKDPKEAFEKISNFGNKLRNMHLLTDPIFEDPSKWGVKPGGVKPENLDDWKVTKVEYKQSEKRVYVNGGQYFEGIEPEVWKYYIGGYQVLDKWLKDRKKVERCLSLDDLMHYMKIVVSLRETINEVQKFT